jgi:hypothetical protein
VGGARYARLVAPFVVLSGAAAAAAGWWLVPWIAGLGGPPA